MTLKETSADVLTAKVIGRIPIEKMVERSVAALSYGFPSAARLINKLRGKRLIIVGGGPSLKETFKDIRRQVKLSKRTITVAVNRTHDWMVSKGLPPDYACIIDPKPWCSNYVQKINPKKTTYLLGAKCDPKTFDNFRDKDGKALPNTFLWHPLEHKDEREALNKHMWPHGPHKELLLVPGMSTTGLRLIELFYNFGVREFELHGMDSSRDLLGDENSQRGNGHAYKKYTESEVEKYNPESDLGLDYAYVTTTDPATGEKYRRLFETSRHMARQCVELENLCKEYRKLNESGQKERIDIKVAGRGLLPYTFAARYGVHVNEAWNKNPRLMPHREPELPEEKNQGNDLDSILGQIKAEPPE